MGVGMQERVNYELFLANFRDENFFRFIFGVSDSHSDYQIHIQFHIHTARKSGEHALSNQYFLDLILKRPRDVSHNFQNSLTSASSDHHS